MIFLQNQPDFPEFDDFGHGSIIALGGKLETDWLIPAYKKGIFPWYDEGEHVIWWSPDPRCVLRPEKMYISHSLRQCIRSGKYRCSINEDFPAVIRACRSVFRPDQDGTWIHQEVIDAFEALHGMGLAWSVETWLGDELAGGLYGVKMGSVFFGESMFHLRPDASKMALHHLTSQSEHLHIGLIDCQMATEHLFSLGAEEIPRSMFQEELKKRIPA